MPDIHIHRKHRLGLAKAREVALQWAEDAEQRLSMECSIVEGDGCNTVEFRRSGVKGELKVEPDQFTLDARLGLLLGAFSKTIEAEIEKNLDALLAPGGAAARKAKADGKTAPAAAKPKPAAKSKAPKRGAKYRAVAATSAIRSGPRTPVSLRRTTCP